MRRQKACQTLKGLAAGEAGVDVVPESHLWLAQTPTQIDLAAVSDAGKVDQALVYVFQNTPQAGNLAHQALKLPRVHKHFAGGFASAVP